MKEKDLQSSRYLYENLNPLLEDESAVCFCILIWQISQLFDDIYDGEKLEKQECLELITRTMIELPNNQFYSSFKHKLQPLIESFLLQWQSANLLENKKEQLEKAYMLRAFVFQIFHFSAMILKGNDFACKNADVFQKIYGETFNDYITEFQNG